MVKMGKFKYLMESENETYRLDLKTNEKAVEEQALWAGLRPGMRVADLGFGSGKTTFTLNRMIQPLGEVVGVDYAVDRINFAKSKYFHETIEYVQHDIREPMENLGLFDFVWIRFVLEYHRSTAFEIIKNAAKILKPGGILQLIDLDQNCLCHYGLPCRLEKAMFDLVTILQQHADFDPYVGRKLYAFLYDLGFKNIEVKMVPHHLIYGEVGNIDVYNWMQKAQVAVKQLGFHFDTYPGGFDEFYDEFLTFFKDPRRLTYTPLFLCRGQKPV